MYAHRLIDLQKCNFQQIYSVVFCFHSMGSSSSSYNIPWPGTQLLMCLRFFLICLFFTFWCAPFADSARFHVGHHIANANRSAGCLPSHVGRLYCLHGFLYAILVDHVLDALHSVRGVLFAPAASLCFDCVLYRHGPQSCSRFEILDCQIHIYFYVRSFDFLGLLLSRP